MYFGDTFVHTTLEERDRTFSMLRFSKKEESLTSAPKSTFGDLGLDGFDLALAAANRGEQVLR